MANKQESERHIIPLCFSRFAPIFGGYLLLTVILALKLTEVHVIKPIMASYVQSWQNLFGSWNVKVDGFPADKLEVRNQKALFFYFRVITYCISVLYGRAVPKTLLSLWQTW